MSRDFCFTPESCRGCRRPARLLWAKTASQKLRVINVPITYLNEPNLTAELNVSLGVLSQKRTVTYLPPLVALFVTLYSLASAQDVNNACKADVATKCKNAPAGQRQLLLCINKHFQDFSEPCQNFLVRNAAAAKSCTFDLERNCKGVTPGDGRIEACLKAHFQQLTERCKASVASSPSFQND